MQEFRNSFADLGVQAVKHDFPLLGAAKGQTEHATSSAVSADPCSEMNVCASFCNTPCMSRIHGRCLAEDDDVIEALLTTAFPPDRADRPIASRNSSFEFRRNWVAPMGLRSRLFFGNEKLEACLVRDSAHVTIYAKGAHVAKIHTALFILDHDSVAIGELRSKTYGPSTAAAVLKCKTRRRIINRAYQTQPDNIVGKMTIASMDDEMRRAESMIPFPPRCLDMS